jgi:hypothetical protein
MEFLSGVHYGSGLPLTSCHRKFRPNTEGERWSKDHTNALQHALFNGDGFESWENVWGTWNGITPRDGEQIRRVGSLLRFLGTLLSLSSVGDENVTLERNEPLRIVPAC